MDDVLKHVKYIGELEADNRDMLETIESLHETVERLSRENERLQNKIKQQYEPTFPPFSMHGELDEMIKKMGKEHFGFRGGKRP